MAGLTGLFRRGSTYYMRVVLPINHPLRNERPTGRIVVSLGAGSYRDALTKGVAKRVEILTGSVVPPAAPVTPSTIDSPIQVPEPVLRLSDLHLRWVAAHAASADSSKACLRAITLFEECVGDVPLHQINRAMGDTFRAWLHQQKSASKTARDRLVWVKGLLNYAAVDLELIPRNPWRGLDIKVRTESPRQPWSEVALKTLFSHPIWTDGVMPTKVASREVV